MNDRRRWKSGGSYKLIQKTTVFETRNSSPVGKKAGPGLGPVVPNSLFQSPCSKVRRLLPHHLQLPGARLPAGSEPQEIRPAG